MERLVTVGSRVGLHARPAALFVKAAAAAPVPVTIARDGGPAVPASSILSVLCLGINHGERVRLVADGEDAVRVLDDLAAMLSRELD